MTQSAIETTPGTWLVGGTAVEEGSVAVWLYANGVWKCRAHGAWIGKTYSQYVPLLAPKGDWGEWETFCEHIKAVVSTGRATLCAYSEASFCHQIACGLYKIDGVDRPLCPPHYSTLVRSTL